jgi:LPXTG-motif cell wall-anchored protein
MYTPHTTTTRRVRRPSVLAALSAIALMVTFLFGAQHAGAAPTTTYPPVTTPPTTQIVIIPRGGDDNIIEAGEPVQFVSDGYAPGTVVTLTILIDLNHDGVLEEVVLTATADENGEAVFDWQIPAGVDSGDYNVEFEGLDGETGEVRTSRGSIHIEALGAFVPGDGSGGGPLPYTGSNSATLVRIAVVLLLAGGISVVAVRRRNANTNA